jgi:hypothetical protein
MKSVICAALAAMCLSLSACNTAPGTGELFMSKQDRNQKDNAICQGYGAKPGTELFIQCRMKQDEIRAATKRSGSTTCFNSFGTLICS